MAGLLFGKRDDAKQNDGGEKDVAQASFVHYKKED